MKTGDDTPLPVTAAVLFCEGKVLLAQRPEKDRLSLKWEFPGGKIEAGESPEACIERELEEELGIVTRAQSRLLTTVHRYSHCSVKLIFISVRLIEGTPCPREHAGIAWVRPDMLLSYDLAPADLPMARMLSRR